MSYNEVCGAPDCPGNHGRRGWCRGERHAEIREMAGARGAFDADVAMDARCRRLRPLIESLFDEGITPLAEIPLDRLMPVGTETKATTVQQLQDLPNVHTIDVDWHDGRWTCTRVA